MTDLRLNLALAALAVLSASASLFVGPGDVGLGAVLGALGGRSEQVDVLILTELRAPRALLGLVIGAGLGAAGAALQGFFRNPLADPGVIGVSASAGLGAVAAMYFGAASLSAFAVPVAAITGAGLGVSLLLITAGGGARATTLILSGVAVGALASALTALLMNLAPNPWALAEIAYWLMGSLNDASWTEMTLGAPLILAGLAVLALSARGLDALSLGEETAASLGVDLPRLRLLIIAGAALAVGGGVAVAGAIGFIGLVIPHLLRPLVQGSPSRLLMPSALGGAALLTLADLAVRLLSGPGGPLYLGVLTALIGAPFFFWLIRATRRQAP